MSPERDQGCLPCILQLPVRSTESDRAMETSHQPGFTRLIVLLSHLSG